MGEFTHVTGQPTIADALLHHGRAAQEVEAGAAGVPLAEAEAAGLPLAALMSNALLFLLIAGMAGSCDSRELKRKFLSKDARGILAGVVCQYVILPFFGYLSLGFFPQDSTIAVTLLLVTTSPGGGFSGVWCSLCNADLALSVAMTTASTIACIAALPFNVYIYVKAMYPDLDVTISFSQLAIGVVVVVSAVLFGASMSWTFNTAHFRQGMNTLGSAAGVALMLIGGASNAVSKDPIWANPPDWFVCVGLPCVLGLAAALVVAKLVGLGKEASVAVAIECCYQNTGLALTIALSAVPPSEVGKAAGVPLFYGLIESEPRSDSTPELAPPDHACLSLILSSTPRVDSGADSHIWVGRVEGGHDVRSERGADLGGAPQELSARRRGV